MVKKTTMLRGAGCIFSQGSLYLLKWPSDDHVSSLSVLLSQSPVFILSSSVLCFSSRNLARSRGKPRNKTRAATGANKTQICSHACKLRLFPHVPFGTHVCTHHGLCAHALKGLPAPCTFIPETWSKAADHAPCGAGTRDLWLIRPSL